MSDNGKLTYYPGIYEILFLLLAITGITFGSDCCSTTETSDSKMACCCSKEQQEAPVCDPVFPEFDKLNMPEDCPCEITAPVNKPEAVALSVGIHLEIPVFTLDYVETSEETFSSDVHSFSLHLQHSTKTYRFTETYLN